MPIAQPVIPTQVGVSRDNLVVWVVTRCYPHAGGGFSQILPDKTDCNMLSPRRWGFLAGRVQRWGCLPVIPTGVGVSRPLCVQWASQYSHPHGRGGFSWRIPFFWALQRLSPRVWGFLDAHVDVLVRRQVIPTGVGLSRFAFLSRSAIMDTSPPGLSRLSTLPKPNIPTSVGFLIKLIA